MQLLRLGPDVLAGRAPVHCRGCYRQTHDLSDEPAVSSACVRVSGAPISGRQTAFT